jgi:integrase
MGRQPSVKNRNLPPRMRIKRLPSGNTFYYYDAGGKPRKWIPLGSDYILAIQDWARLHQALPTERMTVGWLIGKYLASDEYASVGTGTQADYRYAFDKLIDKFGDAPLDQVKASHVTLYIDQRNKGGNGVKPSKHRALREKAVLSMLYAWAIARDFCTANPAGAVKTKRLPGRKNIYIHDDMLDAVYEESPQDLRDAIDLAYYLGQRPGDLLGLTMVKIRDGMLEYRQNKTTTPQRIPLVGGLADVIERIQARKADHKVASLFLLVNESGKKMTKAMLRSRFEAARMAAGIDGKDFQFRDLRRKSGSDLRDQAGLDAAQDLLGHKSQAMTEHYTAARGKKVATVLQSRQTSRK